MALPLSQTQAIANIRAKVNSEPVIRRLAHMARRAPDITRRVLGTAVALWHGAAVPHIPVRASISRKQRRRGVRGSLFSRTGRGRLRESTQPFVETRGEVIIGGIRSAVPYAIWLAAGTRHIASGRVIHWREGQPTIKSWPAKKGLVRYRRKAGVVWLKRGLPGNPQAELPIVLPWRISVGLKHLQRELPKAILDKR